MDPQVFWQSEQSASPPVAAEEESPVAAGEPESNPESQPETPDYEARARELEEKLQQEQSRAQQYESTLGQIQNWYQQNTLQQQQQQEDERFNQEWSKALDVSEAMSRDEARRFLNSRFTELNNERNNAYQQRMAQERQQWDTTLRRVAKPEFVRNLAKDAELSDEDVQYLMTFDDPDVAAQVVPQLKAQNQRFKQMQEQIKQLSRTQQANQLQSTGIGNVGGTISHGAPIELPDDPDDAAIAILHATTRRN